MNDGIDYKKVESCMVEISGLPDYNETSNTFLLYNKIRYLTATGIPILRVDGKSTHLGLIRKSVDESMFDPWSMSRINDFIHNIKMCRVNWIGLNTKVGGEYNDELNIGTHHPLTDSQRRVILDIIKVSGLLPNKIYIDDLQDKNDIISDEQLVKRQLRLHSIVAQFHR